MKRAIPIPASPKRTPLPLAGFSLILLNETIFPDREAVPKHTGLRLSPLKQRGTAMLVAIINSIYRHFVVAAIVGMAVTQGGRR
jgi:hypothetical protein